MGTAETILTVLGVFAGMGLFLWLTWLIYESHRMAKCSGYHLRDIESKLDKLISMQDWNEMADEAERKDGEDG